MDINLELNGHDMTVSDTFYIAENPEVLSAKQQIIARPRIGIKCDPEWMEKPLRFYLAGHACVSRL